MNVLATDVLFWMLIVGFVGFAAMGIDKALARSNWGERISERTLWGVAMAGGFVGVVVGALIFHHKTSKVEFWPPVVLAVILWVAILVLVNLGRLSY